MQNRLFLAATAHGGAQGACLREANSIGTEGMHGETYIGEA